MSIVNTPAEANVAMALDRIRAAREMSDVVNKFCDLQEAIQEFCEAVGESAAPLAQMTEELMSRWESKGER